MKKNTVAIISSPFQLLSFGEYVSQYKLERYELIVIYYSRKEHEQITEINKIYNLNITSLFRGYSFFQYCQLFFLAKKIKSCDEIVLGNYFSDPQLLFCNLVQKDKVLVVDDGMIVNSIPDYIGTENRILQNSWLKKCFIRLLKIDLTYPANITLYSMFNLKEHKSIFQIKNNLVKLTEELSDVEQDNTFMIVGQPLVELGMMSLDNYIRCLTNLAEQLGELKATYFPSRKEETNKLEALSAVKGLQIIRSPKSIELHLLKQEYLPKKIFGFTSTALITLNTLFNAKEILIDIYAVDVDYNNARLPREVILKMYATLYDAGIHPYKINTYETIISS